MSGSVGYNPNDPTQSAFLASLASGESGGTSNPYSVGYGGVNLSGAATDAYGFPLWSGASSPYGTTQAAGAYQFQPATWDSVASQYGLNFQNPNDQNAGAWYEAQNVYAQKTGGGSLYGALQAGDYQGVAQVLQGTWPSTSAQSIAAAETTGATVPSGSYSTPGTTSGATNYTNAGYYTGSSGAWGGGTPGGMGLGNGSSVTGTTAQAQAQQGSAAAAAGVGMPLDVSIEPGLAAGIGGWISSLESGIGSSIQGAVGSVVGSAENWFGRGFLILIGLMLVVIALWAMLSKAGVAPSPGETLKGAVAAAG